MASSPGSGADCDNTSVSYPVGVSELTFDTDSVINHYATNATKPPAAKHCTFDALCGTPERFLDDSFQAGRHAFTGGVEPTNFHSTLSGRFFLGNSLQHLTELSDKASTVRNVHVPMRPHPDNTSEATGIKRSNFHFDDQTGSLHAVSIRSEVSNRRPVPNAYNSFVPPTTNNGDKDVKGDGGHDKGPCTRCGKKGHTKIKCFKPKTECHLCGADHLTAFCINAKGNHRRAELTVSSLETIVKERDEALNFVTPPSDKTGGPSLAPSTDPGELKLAYAAAAAAAASETDPNKAAAAYTACLGAFGYI